MAEAIVVGAGMAGLSAADALSRAGWEVLVLEARDRVGGRVWSPTLDNGVVVELGGEWIASGQVAALGMVRALGLGLVDPGIDFVSRDAVGGEAIPLQEHRRVNRALAGAFDSLNPTQAEWMTAAELLDRVGEDTMAFQVLRSRLEGTCGAPLERVAASEIGADFGFGEHAYYRVEGGNQLIASRLAAPLDVQLGAVVQSVSQDRARVEVDAGGRVLTAEALVLAVPLPCLARIRFDPVLPDPVAGVIHSLEMGTAAKVVMETVDAPPLFRRQDTDIPAWYWTGLDELGEVRRAVTGFAGSERGVSALLVAPRQRLQAAAPEAPVSGEPRVVDWGSDPFAGGCYSVIGPGQRSSLSELQRAWGRVVFAGEHVNGSGSIDGAIRSGLDAARVIRSRVREG